MWFFFKFVVLIEETIMVEYPRTSKNVFGRWENAAESRAPEASGRRPRCHGNTAAHVDGGPWYRLHLCTLGDPLKMEIGQKMQYGDI